MAYGIFSLFVFVSLYGCKSRSQFPKAAGILAESESPKNRLFSSADVLDFELTGPFSKIFEHQQIESESEESDVLALPGTLKIKNENKTTEIPVMIQSRGQSSLLDCQFLKLTVKIPKAARASATGSVFEGIKGFKVGTHCSKPPETVDPTFGRLGNELSTWREALVYQVLEGILPTVFRTRYAKIIYNSTDGNGKAPPTDFGVSKKAFLLETNGTMLDRLGPTFEKGIGLGELPRSDVKYDHQNVLLFAAAQLFVGNSDFGLRDGDVQIQGASPMQNVKAFYEKRDGSTFGIFVPYDFDISRYVSLGDPQDFKLFGVTLFPEFLAGVPEDVRTFVGNIFVATHDFVGKSYGDLAPKFRHIASQKDNLLKIINKSPVESSQKEQWKLGLATLEEFTKLNLDKLPHFVVDKVELFDDKGELRCQFALAQGHPIIAKVITKERVQIKFVFNKTVDAICKNRGFVVNSLKEDFFVKSAALGNIDQ